MYGLALRGARSKHNHNGMNDRQQKRERVSPPRYKHNHWNNYKHPDQQTTHHCPCVDPELTEHVVKVVRRCYRSSHETCNAYWSCPGIIQ